MKTKSIGAFSTRGGNGKSLLLANLALFLSRLGKSVAVIDLDANAPSLPMDPAAGVFKFRGAVEPAKNQNRGFVRLVESLIFPNSQPDWSDVDQVHQNLSSLRGHKVSAEDYVHTLTTPGNYGRIHFMPFGNVTLREQHGTVWRNGWNWLFNPSITETDSGRDFVLALRGSFDTLGVDYLLFDTGSGLTALNAFIVRHLVEDRWIYLFPRAETRSDMFLQLLETHGGGLDAVYPVFSRAALGVENNDCQFWVNYPGLRKRFSTVHVCPDIEREGTVVLSHQGRELTCFQRGLAREYLTAFSRLLNLPDSLTSLEQKFGFQP